MRIGNTLYFDHHASTPIDSRVLDTMAPFFGESFANPHSSDHALGWASGKAVDKAAAAVAGLVGGDADEIVFVSGATEANNLALLGLRGEGAKRAGSKVVLGAADHKSVLATGRALHRYGVGVAHVSVDAEGRVDLAELEEQLRSSDVLVLSVCLVNSEIGTIQDVPAIHEIAALHGVLVHWDASQAPCALDVSQLADMADMISLSGHKIYGPKGIGALLVKHELQDRIEPIIHGGGQQRNLRSGTLPTPLCVGMGTAAGLLTGTAAKIERTELERLRDSFVDQLRHLPWPIELNGPDFSRRHPGNANMRFTGFSAHDLLGSLQPALAASIGSACTSGVAEPSHVLRAIGLRDEDAESSIRFGLGRGTTSEDVSEAIRLITSALHKLADAGLQKQYASLL